MGDRSEDPEVLKNRKLGNLPAASNDVRDSENTNRDNLNTYANTTRQPQEVRKQSRNGDYNLLHDKALNCTSFIRIW